MDEMQAEQQHVEGGQHTPEQEAPNQLTKNTQVTWGSSSSYFPRGQEMNHPHQQLESKLRNIWETQCNEVATATDFKKNALPLSKIKKIMKADGDVKMVAHESVLLFSKACEMFITDLTMRASVNLEMDMRKVLQMRDIASAVSGNELFDFLVDIVPRDETVERQVRVGIPLPPMRENAAEIVQNVPPPPPPPNYFMPSPPPQYFGATIPFDHGQQPLHPYGLQQVMYPAPNHLMMKSSSDSDDQNKK